VRITLNKAAKRWNVLSEDSHLPAVVAQDLRSLKRAYRTLDDQSLGDSEDGNISNMLRDTVPMPCHQLTSPYCQGSWQPCFFASGCNHDGVISLVRRVASA
jgi:hypothetical protein